MKTIILLVVIFTLGLLGIYHFDNPLRPHLPTIVQALANLKDQNHGHIATQTEIELMSTDPTYCTKNTDCLLEMCGSTPNCNSYTINHHYQNQKNQHFSCSKNQCHPEYDLYVACLQNICTIKHFFPHSQ